MLQWIRQNWSHALLLLAPICISYGALLAIEGVAISWIDRWLPVSTFESATRAALFVTAGATWLRLCLIGAGVYLIARRIGQTAPTAGRFAIIWSVGSATIALAILAIDLGQHDLQYAGVSYAGETVRSILLAFIYAKILLVYPGVRILIGAARAPADEKPHGLIAAWRATSLAQSTLLFFLLIVLKMIIETVFVNVLSYMPFVTPFWFVPDELSRVRFFVGQGTRIVAESIGVAVYVAFFIAISQKQTQHQT